MCSPTRAALLTGLNSHLAGFGTVAHVDPGFPGYTSELPDNAATLAEILRDHGYATLMVGKWHLAKDSDCNAAGAQHSWPCQRGFDRFYGILDAFTNLHQPHRLVEDNHVVEVDRYPDGYYLTDDLTDRAIAMVRERKVSNPAKPFFLYFPHCAVHAPLHAKPDDIARYRGRYDQGWDQLREERFARQRELGVVDEHAACASQHRAGSRGAGLGRSDRPGARALRAPYGGLCGHGRSGRPIGWTPRRRARRDRRARQHPLLLHLGQRGLTRGRSRRHILLLRASAARRRCRRRLCAPRPHRRPADHAALPAWLGDGGQHAVPLVQDQHARGRPFRAVRRLVARRLRRSRHAAPAVRARDRRAPDRARSRRARAAVDAPWCAARTDRRDEPGSCAARARRREQPLRAALRVPGPPRLLSRRLGSGDGAPAVHAVPRRGVGAVPPRGRPDRAR